MTTPNSIREVVSVDSFRLFLVNALGIQHPLLFIDRFSRREAIYSATAAEFTALGVAKVLVNRYILLWGCRVKLLSDNGLQFVLSFRLQSTI